jgi:RNA polymerase sigma-70 factor (ECF subfamily)
MTELDERVRSYLAAGETDAAATLALRELGPEIMGFLSGVLGNADADEVFADLSERLWRALKGFEGRCSVRTWAYVLARHELGRFRKGRRRYASCRVRISGLQDVLAATRSTTGRVAATERRRCLRALRDELPVDDRTLLILRVDRNLAWDDIALAFADSPETLGEAGRKRVAARLRKRFQLLKRRLAVRVRAAVAGERDERAIE